MASLIAHPVQTLREHATGFEAALSVCLANPRPRAVHKLRTESRRLEAQIALLNELHGLPPHRTEAAAMLRHMKKIRQAAGHVRDFDVQIGLLQSKEKQKVPAAIATAMGETQTEVRDERHADLEQMIATREQLRIRGAAELVALIDKRQAKVSAALEQLFEALKPVKSMRIPAAELVRVAEERFRRNRALSRKKPSTDDLHTIRKAAKQTRYLAETSTASVAVNAAARYERLQEAGGKWHDWLDLAVHAKKELGRKHTATLEFVALRERYLLAYQLQLGEFRKQAVAQNGKSVRRHKKKADPSAVARKVKRTLESPHEQITPASAAEDHIAAKIA